MTTPRLFTIDGITATLREHASRLNVVPLSTAHRRIARYNWPAERALRTPVLTPEQAAKLPPRPEQREQLGVSPDPLPTSRPGVYAITDPVTGDTYVGSSRNITNRWRTHRSYLKNGRHQRKLQAAHDAHAPLTFKVLEFYDGPDLAGREALWIALLRPTLNTDTTQHIKAMHLASGSTIPLATVKHRVLKQGMDLADALAKSNSEVMAEAMRARWGSRPKPPRPPKKVPQRLVVYEIDGVSDTLENHWLRCGAARLTTVIQRIKAGWDPKIALRSCSHTTTPPRSSTPKP